MRVGGRRELPNLQKVTSVMEVLQVTDPLEMMSNSTNLTTDINTALHNLNNQTKLDMFYFYEVRLFWRETIISSLFHKFVV